MSGSSPLVSGGGFWVVVPVPGGEKNCAAFGIGLSMTRHPRMGAAGRPQVAVRRLVENKPNRGCRAPAKSTRVNLLILMEARVEPRSRSFPSDRPAWGGEAW